MFSLNFNLILAWYDPIVNFFKDVFQWIMELLEVVLVVLVQPLYIVFMGICKLLDIFELIAKKLAGMDVIYMNGSPVNGDLTLSLLNDANVWKSFTAMLALGSLLLFVTTFIAVVKSQMSQGQRTSVKTVVTNFIKALINFTIVPVLCFAGIYFGNHLLRALDAATNQSSANTVSGAVFLCASFDANKARNPSSRLVEDYLGPDASSDANTFNGTFKISNGTDTAATAIDHAFVQQKSGNCTMKYHVMHKLLLGSPFAGIPANPVPIFGGLLNGDADEGGIWYIEGTGNITFTYYNVSLVSIYYNMMTFNYVIGIGAGIMLLFAYLDLIFGLIKRLYYIVTLFIIAPPIIALYPLDEGRALNSWKQQFVGNVISAYSAVVCMNIYLMLMGVFQGVTLFAEGSSTAVNADEVVYVEAASAGEILDAGKKALANLGITLANEICQTFIIIGGAMFFKQMVGEVSRIVGANDAMQEGGGMTKRIANGVKKTIGAAATVAAAVYTGGAAVAAKGAAMKATKAANAARKKQYLDIAKQNAKDAEGGGGGGGEGPAPETEEPKNDKPEAPAVKNGGEEGSSSGSGEAENKEGGTAEEKAAAGKEAENQEKKKMEEKDKEEAKAAEEEVKQEAKEEENAAKAEANAASKASPADPKKIPKSTRWHTASSLRKMSGATEDQIHQIEKEYQEKVRAANAYNPIKNPIKARLRGMKENLEKRAYGKYSWEDQQAARGYFAEQSGRKAAMKARVDELKDDYKVAKAMGNQAMMSDAKMNLHNYMKAISNGLQKNDAYWREEVAVQKKITDNQNRMNNLLKDLKMLESTGKNVEDVKRQIAEVDHKIAQLQRIRPKPE